MARLALFDPCCSCGGLLVPPDVLPYRTHPQADYVCLRCERPYWWGGDPPRLLTDRTIGAAADEDPER